MKAKNIKLYRSDKEIIKFINSKFKSLKFKKMNIALTGGNSWLVLYKKLLKKNIFKRSYNYFLTDERCTKVKYLQNYHKLRKNFDYKIKINKFYNFSDISKNLENYQKLLPRRFDIIFTSLGIDGHVLSWFTNDLGWKSSKKVSVIIEKSLRVKQRLTLNKNFVNKSKTILLLVRKNKIKIFNHSKVRKTFPINHLKASHIFIEK